MSLLTPLYLLGAGAIALPVIWHLIRRTPRGSTSFSAMMFLSPSPPRITKRSRLDHLPLLTLRALALGLVALAFARPFRRREEPLTVAAAPQRVVAIVVDSSASMRRADVWHSATRLVDAALADCRPRDRVGVFLADETLRPLVDFAELRTATPVERGAVVRQRMAAARPSWRSTRLGECLVDALSRTAAAAPAQGADAPQQGADDERAARHLPRRIVLISDMQSSCRLAPLGDVPWPPQVDLKLMPTVPEDRTNAGLELLAAESAAQRRPGEQATLRVRVRNAADSSREQFQLQWRDAAEPAEQAAAASPASVMEVYVPAGESRVVRAPLPPPAAAAPTLTLRGDDHDFDNRLHVVAARTRKATIAYVGNDRGDDPQGLRYYVENAAAAMVEPETAVLAVEATALRAEAAAQEDAGAPIRLAIVGSEPSPAAAAELRRFADEGGTACYAIRRDDSPAGLQALAAAPDAVLSEAATDSAQFGLWAEIDFAHPLFVGMAQSKFNDFSRIRFWRRRRLDPATLPGMQVVASFDDGAPAVLQQSAGRGRLLLLTSTWAPADSQLARSWKFLALLTAMGEPPTDVPVLRGNYVVGDRVQLPPRTKLASPVRATLPGGSDALLAIGTTQFTATDAPGRYALAGVSGPLPFAVNLDPRESETDPLSPEAFEQAGCRLAGGEAAVADRQRAVHLRDAQQEAQQRWWQRLLAAALAVLAVESWLAGRLSRLPAEVPSVAPPGLARGDLPAAW